MSPHRPSVHEAGHVLAFAPLAALAVNEFPFEAWVYPLLSPRHFAGSSGRVSVRGVLDVANENAESAARMYAMMLAAGAAGERVGLGCERSYGCESDRAQFEAYTQDRGVAVDWETACAAAERYLRKRREVLSDLSWRLDERTLLTKGEALIYWLRCNQ